MAKRGEKQQWQQANHIEVLADRDPIFRDNYRSLVMHGFAHDPVEVEQVKEWLISAFYRRERLAEAKRQKQGSRPRWQEEAVRDLEEVLS